MAGDSRIGTELAGYRIESVLGRGGMSVVYLAEQSFPQRLVALKLLAPELSSDPVFRDRFIKESNAAASIEHPNIVPIYQAGEADGALYIAMRRVDSDLKTLIEGDGPLQAGRAARIVSQVASALDAAHRRGLIHRDVKPSNVLIGRGEDEEGADHAYLSDFGLIKRRDRESGITKTGQFLGTIDYVAPEQVQGGSVDHRVDVYSLGCVLYEALTGKPPFDRDNDAALLYAHLNDPPPSVRAHRPDLPAAVDDVVAKAMAKRPDDRYQSAGELASAARRALGATSDPEMTTAPPPASGPRRRGRMVLAGVVLAAAVVAVALVLLTRGGAKPHAGATTTPPVSPTTSSAPAPPSGPPPGSVAAVDPATRKVVKIASNVPTGQTVGGNAFAGFGLALAVGEGGVWTYADPIMSRVDLRTARAGLPIAVGSTVNVGEGTAVVVAFRSVWALGNNGVSVVDPATSRIIHPIRLSTGTVPSLEPTTLAAADGAIWVTLGTGMLLRIDPSTLHRDEFTVGGNPTAMVEGAGALWIADKGASTITRFDLAKHRAGKPITLNGNLDQMAFGAGRVWVLDQTAGQVTPIDARSGLPGPPVRVGSHPTGIVAGLGAVWVSDRDGSIYRVDFNTRARSAIRVGSPLVAIAIDPHAGRLWVLVSLG